MRFYKSNQGMSLVEITVVMGTLILLTMGITSIIMVVSKHVKTTENSTQRNLTIFGISKTLAVSNTIKLSSQLLPQNEKLFACVLGGATSTCASNCCNHNESFEFYGLDPTGIIPNPTDRKKITGITGSSVNYSLSGDSCNPSLAFPNGCAYQLVTSATSYCPAAVANCNHAEYLSINLEVKPYAGYSIKPQIIKLVHFVNLNYKPTIPPVAAQTLNVSEIRNISITPNPGFPLEPATFFFSKCDSSNPAVATVKCYGFIDGRGTITIEGKAPGNVNITLQVNDTQEENFLSDDMIFPITVN